MHFLNRTIVPCAASAAVWLTTSHASAYTVETILDSGPSSNRIDLVILGDGYRTEDQAKLTSDANSFVQRLGNHELYSRYLSHFNIKVIHVVSAERGADQGSYGAERDTALGATFWLAGIERLMGTDSNMVMSVAASHTPEFDHLVVLVNDPKYGGSGGSYAVASTNLQSADIAIHELGHSLFDLGDEYPSSAAQSYRHNISSSYFYAELKWADWVTYGTPLPTPSGNNFSDFVGAFEFSASPGRYRPVDTHCMMNNYNYDFCPVCTEASVLGIYEHVSLIEATSPASSITLSASSNTEPTFTVQSPIPVPNTLSYTWYYDGFVIGTTNVGSATLPSFFLSPGAHWLGVIVSDTTELVRNDEAGLLNEAHVWNLNVEP